MRVSEEVYCKASFTEFLASLDTAASDITSIEGKIIGNSDKDKAFHIVRAWCHNNQLVFGQEKVDEKSTEVPPRCSNFWILRKIIIINARECQRDIFQKIIDPKGD
ncbi:hypothetical protein [Holospora curviuscula]|uniref:Uncharacterized protein n=1 Tax=Holospora curviuscula TaxID=1082868 RepID=A0A2S5REF5_9PROT|nr:hypothetical protein [Holospora curviuscula]PPE05690.1 hypothetical protein HCUR_00175 [Holospora curviuscula]